MPVTKTSNPHYQAGLDTGEQVNHKDLNKERNDTSPDKARYNAYKSILEADDENTSAAGITAEGLFACLLMSTGLAQAVHRMTSCGYDLKALCGRVAALIEVKTRIVAFGARATIKLEPLQRLNLLRKRALVVAQLFIEQDGDFAYEVCLVFHGRTLHKWLKQGGKNGERGNIVNFYVSTIQNEETMVRKFIDTQTLEAMGALNVHDFSPEGAIEAIKEFLDN